MDAAISRRGPMRASEEDSYLRMRMVIKAIPTGFQRISKFARRLG